MANQSFADEFSKFREKNSSLIEILHDFEFDNQTKKNIQSAKILEKYEKELNKYRFKVEMYLDSKIFEEFVTTVQSSLPSISKKDIATFFHDISMYYRFIRSEMLSTKKYTQPEKVNESQESQIEYNKFLLNDNADANYIDKIKGVYPFFYKIMIKNKPNINKKDISDETKKIEYKFKPRKPVPPKPGEDLTITINGFSNFENYFEIIQDSIENIEEKMQSDIEKSESEIQPEPEQDDKTKSQLYSKPLEDKPYKAFNIDLKGEYLLDW